MLVSLEFFLYAIKMLHVDKADMTISVGVRLLILLPTNSNFETSINLQYSYFSKFYKPFENNYFLPKIYNTRPHNIQRFMF